MALPLVKVTRKLAAICSLYFAGVFVTLFYVALGVHNGAPLLAAQQVIIIYVISPVLWLIIGCGMVRSIESERLVTWFVILAYFCCASVGLYFMLFLSFGPDAVSFFKEAGNLNLQEGYAAATMFVYGSLIFLTGAFFATPDVINSRPTRLLLLGALTLCAITSGRAALILSMPLGLLWSALLTRRQTRYRLISGGRAKLIRNVAVVSMSAVVFAFLLAQFTDINLWVVLNGFIGKVVSGGGQARSEQAAALWSGILESSGLGRGHGVGVDYVRSYEYPWRYELVWLATVLRVGLIGAVVYSLPFVVYIVSALRAVLRGLLTVQDKFLFAGFLTAFVASATNPYIESFAFQWMYVIPIVWFFGRDRSSNSAVDHART
ncbi:MAG TPA: hypothetical protein VGJ62_07770 [Gemmatimonadaceae bacterium]|jgi:hypothetical protein